MSPRIPHPNLRVVGTTPDAVPEAPMPAAVVADASAGRRFAFTTGADLVSVTPGSWRIHRTPSLGVVTAPGEVRRTWSRGPRR